MTNVFDIPFFLQSIAVLLAQAHITLAIVFAVAAGGSLLAFVLAMCGRYPFPLLYQACQVYTSLFRGTPLIVQLFIAYFGVPAILGRAGIDLAHVEPLWFAMVTLALNEAAFLSTVVSAAFSSVGRGQVDAALAIGLTHRQALQRIVAPQAFRILLPGWGTSVVSLLKDTSIVFTIGVFDMMGTASALAARSYKPLETYAAAALIFVAASVALEAALRALRHRLDMPYRACGGQHGV